jgi:hypothetical protein
MMIDGISFAIGISEDKKLMSLVLLMKVALYDIRSLQQTRADIENTLNRFLKLM